MTDTPDGSLALRLGYAAAHRMAASDPDLDDLAQEAALTVVRVQAKKPHSTTDYLAGVARMQVRKTLHTERAWTGSTNARTSLDPLRRVGNTGLDTLSDHEEPVAPDDMAVIDWASLRPEIEAAIHSLPDRGRAVGRRVAQGVLCGLTSGEAGRAVGVGPSAGHAAWSYARRHLGARLAHLKVA